VATLSADQTGVVATTWTKVNFNTSAFNQNGKFNTSNGRFTPSAGAVQIEADVYMNGSSNTGVAIFKNGVQLRQGNIPSSQAIVVIVDVANGTDYYECFVYSSVAGSVNSTPTLTYFQAHAVLAQGPQGATGPAGGAGPADAFTARMSADQTGVLASTWTKCNFNTASYNQGNRFNIANGRYTPAAGPVHIVAQIYPSAGGTVLAAIYKNGVVLGESEFAGAGTTPPLTIVDNANGTDYYECYGYSTSACTFYSNPVTTWFQGFAIPAMGPAGPQGPQGATGPAGGAGPIDSFIATLSADQTGFPASTWAKINFNTTSYNQGNRFNTANSRFTPATGPVQLAAQMYVSAGAPTAVYIGFMKNGNVFKYNYGLADPLVACAAVDYANGTDYYEVTANINAAGTISSTALATWFNGYALPAMGPAGPQGPPGSITGGISGTTIDNTIIGGTTPAAGTFTSMSCKMTIAGKPALLIDGWAAIDASGGPNMIGGANVYYDLIAGAWKTINASSAGYGSFQITNAGIYFGGSTAAVTAGQTVTPPVNKCWTTLDFNYAPVNKAGDSLTGGLYVNYGLYLQGAYGSQSGNMSTTNGGAAGWGNAFFAMANGSVGGNACAIRSDSTNANLCVFIAGSNTVGSIYTNGTTTAYNTTSDIRKKRNIRPLTDEIDTGAMIDAMEPVAFEWITPDDHPESFEANPTDHGFVAQHLVDIAPFAVHRGDDEPELRPMEMRVDEPPGGREWSIDYGKLVPYLVAELQALRKRVAELEAR
jgi:hypothetical protein